MRIGLVFGGKSTEHVVSVLSATNIERELLALGHIVTPYFVDTTGKWFQVDKSPSNPLKNSLNNLTPVTLNLSTFEPFKSLDLFFPVIHGTLGEDGCLQGLFRLLDIPFIGPDVLNSAIGMDKEITKRLLKDKGFNLANYFCIQKGEDYNLEDIAKALSFPCFIKPANLGSSIAITKAKNLQEMIEGVTLAFEHDTKILIEEAINAIDVECGIIGTESPIVSLPIALRTTHEFYDYEAKYFNKSALFTEAPLKCSPELTETVQDLSLQIYRHLRCHSMARVDFLMTPDGQFYINEINTIPGFTDSSGFPVAFEVSGYPYPKLLSYLIDDALKYHQKKKELKVVSPEVVGI